MTLGEGIKKAVSERNAYMAGRIADRLRFEQGLNYNQIAKLFEEHAGCNACDFENLMFEADQLATREVMEGVTQVNLNHPRAFDALHDMLGD